MAVIARPAFLGSVRLCAPHIRAVLENDRVWRLAAAEAPPDPPDPGVAVSYTSTDKQLRERPINPALPLIRGVESCVHHLRQQCGPKIHEALPNADSVLEIRNSGSKFQHQLTVIVEAVLSPQIIARLPLRDRRRMESSREASARRFFHSRPTEKALTISDGAYRLAMAVNIGSMPRPLHLPDVCICGVRFGGDVNHFLFCKIMHKHVNRLHNGIRDELHNTIIEIGCQSQVELVESSRETRLRPDLTVLTSQGRFLVDVATVCTSAPSYEDSTAEAQRQRRERSKHAKYDWIARNENSTVVPFVVDSYGALGKEATQFLNTLATEAGIRIGADVGPWKARARARLLTALHAGNALLVCDSSNELHRRIAESRGLDRPRQHHHQLQQRRPPPMPFVAWHNHSHASAARDSGEAYDRAANIAAAFAPRHMHPDRHRMLAGAAAGAVDGAAAGAADGAVAGAADDAAAGLEAGIDAGAAAGADR
jgi:hypothetical protein